MNRVEHGPLVEAGMLPGVVSSDSDLVAEMLANESGRIGASGDLVDALKAVLPRLDGAFSLVIMAWYGVNFVLGKGLHSYGFGIGGETYVAAFVILDLLFVGFAVWRYRMSKPTGREAREIEGEPVVAGVADPGI